jgi:DNA polymerase-3 subunit beta
MFDGNVAIFSFGSFTLTTRLLEGKYLSHKSIIPSGYEISAIMDRESLVNAVKRVSLMANSSELVTVSFSTGTCTVESEDLDNSKYAVESINCEYSGEIFKIGMCATYLTSALKSISTDSVMVMVNSPLRPALFFEHEGQRDYDYMSMLMPMKF